MKLKWLVIISVCVMMISSCHSSKKTAAVTESPNECESMTFNKSALSNIQTDYYSVDSMYIENDCLVIWVNYSGGCGDADFTLYYSDRVMESMPPKSNLLLQLVDQDDCRAIVEQKLYFNLSFFDNYAIQDGINLRLSGIGKTVLYKK
jgi:protein involved in sex pheromone biosynthesis